MFYRVKFIPFVIAIFLSFNVNAQTFYGKIFNKEKKPLESVYVYNRNSNSHDHTNFYGDFKLLNSKVNDTIEINVLGYNKTQIILNDKALLDSENSIFLETKFYELDELVLRNNKDALKTIASVDLALDPVRSSQEVLQKVPGLFIGQHAGGGKAEQIFLRGFDIDHGTDLTISVDGMPVNIVSHSHGQGYSDLHFLIPETIKKIDFGKGPYYASQGDFNTAGYVNFKTKNNIDENKISLELGQFNTFRTLGLFNLLGNKGNQSAYAAIEYLASDGFFESSQNFSRINLFAKYNTYLYDNSRLTLTTSHFTSRWDASGQIPEREIANGNITRFGAIDDTEGGETSRTNINLEHKKTLKDDKEIASNIFYTSYKFKLYSNFTFFLEDSINGDQIRQAENRDVFGFNTRISKEVSLNTFDVQLNFGTGFRLDIIKDLELSHTLNRRQLVDNIQLGEVYQNNYYAFSEATFNFEKFKINTALRLDYFKFSYNDFLQTNYKTQSESKAILNPKLNFFYTPSNKVQWFLKSGIGFHSNDTRVAVQQNRKTLPKAYGLDLGAVWKPVSKLVVNTALWYLFSEEEFVYVGDAGIVEPSGKSQRYGVDLGLRYQFTNWLYLNSDITYTKAKSLANNSGEDFIPLAPKVTATGGLFLKDKNNFSGGLQFKYIADRAANEANTIVAEGYFITDVTLNYTINNITIGASIKNIFDTDWKETQFATESRLQNENDSVEEIHFTPGTPFSAKLTLNYAF